MLCLRLYNYRNLLRWVPSALYPQTRSGPIPLRVSTQHPGHLNLTRKAPPPIRARRSCFSTEGTNSLSQIGNYSLTGAGFEDSASFHTNNAPMA